MHGPDRLMDGRDVGPRWTGVFASLRQDVDGDEGSLGLGLRSGDGDGCGVFFFFWLRMHVPHGDGMGWDGVRRWGDEGEVRKADAGRWRLIPERGEDRDARTLLATAWPAFGGWLHAYSFLPLVIIIINPWLVAFPSRPSAVISCSISTPAPSSLHICSSSSPPIPRAERDRSTHAFPHPPPFSSLFFAPQARLVRHGDAE